MDRKELKQKIRRLKKLELMVRYGYSIAFIESDAGANVISKLPLVWYEFFCLKETTKHIVKYTINELEQMNTEELRKVFDEFWFQLYCRIYREKGISMVDEQETELLKFLDLPYDADEEMVKKRFRELCKIYHPDEGGNQDKFIELVEMMKRHDVKK